MRSSARRRRNPRSRRSRACRRNPLRDASACNEALLPLLLHALAFNLANVGRQGMEQATRSGWTIRSFRGHVLKTPARVLLHARRAVVVLGDIAAYHWQCLAHFQATLGPQSAAPASALARAP